MGGQGADQLMPYLSAQDMIDRIGEARLAEVTMRDGMVTGIDMSALDTAVDDAISEVESYVGGRYDPAAPPRVLTVHAAALAWYRLLGDRAPAIEGAARAYRDAIEFLRRARDGDVALGDETPSEATNAPSGSPRVATPPGTFTRDSLRGF